MLANFVTGHTECPDGATHVSDLDSPSDSVYDVKKSLGLII